MYLHKATGDPTFLQLGRDAVESIEKISRVKCGFASVSTETLILSGLRQIPQTPEDNSLDPLVQYFL